MPYSKQSPKSYIHHHKEAVKIFTGYISEHRLTGEREKGLIDNLQLSQLLKEFHGVISILDFSTLGYIYMSESVKSVTGYSHEEFYEKGIQMTISLLPEEQLKIIHNQIFPIMFDHFDRCTSLEEIKDLRVTFNYNAFRKDGSLGSFLQQLSVIHGDDCKKASIALILVTDISDFKHDGNMTLGISKKNEDGVYHPIFTKNYLSDSEPNILSIRELEILNLMRHGKSSNEISDMLFISEHTVYNHRKKMLKKMDAKNTGELLSKSIAYGLL